MWEHAKNITSLTVHASDGTLGAVDDLYFDDERWTVRYLVLSTGNWLTGRLVLVSPIAVTGIDRERARLDVALSREQVERSPSIDAHRPVSRQHEAAYATYYGYPPYWSGPGLWGAAEYPAALTAVAPIDPDVARPHASAPGATDPDMAKTPRPEGDSHLRSAREVTGYDIHASDGPAGHLQDFVIDTGSWAIRLLIVDTSRWFAGRKVLMAPAAIRHIRWADRVLEVAVSRDTVTSGPEWDKRAPIDEQFEERIARHYGRA